MRFSKPSLSSNWHKSSKRIAASAAPLRSRPSVFSAPITASYTVSPPTFRTTNWRVVANPVSRPEAGLFGRGRSAAAPPAGSRYSETGSKIGGVDAGALSGALQNSCETALPKTIAVWHQSFYTHGGLRFPEDKPHFGPRLGAAYRIPNKTVLRAGYGKN